jgi:hypothetical protein
VDARVILNLNGHCVETAARNEFRRLMDAIFDETGDTSGLEARIELIRAFLDTADFSALRASDTRLAGETEAAVELSRDAGGKFRMEFV